MAFKNIVNIMIEFDIVTHSEIDALKTEWDTLISSGKKIYLWSKAITPDTMCQWCKDKGVYDYVWGYLVKDSVNYSKADFVIDNNERFVDRFKSSGIPGNYIESI
jgi:hypothetical protein